jgi:hypothetical protein
MTPSPCHDSAPKVYNRFLDDEKDTDGINVVAITRVGNTTAKAHGPVIPIECAKTVTGPSIAKLRYAEKLTLPRCLITGLTRWRPVPRPLTVARTPNNKPKLGTSFTLV